MKAQVLSTVPVSNIKVLAVIALFSVGLCITGYAGDWTFSLKQAGGKAVGPIEFKDDASLTLLTKEFTLLETDEDKKTFKLKMTESGNVFGPFQLKNSGRVQIGRATFSVEDLFIPGLKLSVSYLGGMAGAKGILDELLGIFAPFGEAEVDLEPHPDITIFKGIDYLAPIATAGKTIGLKRMVSGSSVNPPGFPRNSFRYYQSTGTFADGCNKALLVTDLQNQAVAVQFVDENPSKTRLSSTTAGARVYNIIQFRQTTPSSRNYVRRSASTSGDIVIIKHEYIQNGKIKEYTELHVPKIIVNVLLETMQHFRNK